ncbi:hypothetical protein JOH51_007506 [Rhizobium leguminosarum]|nr:hypothetical protein [Rhizobium leguminosarum]
MGAIRYRSVISILKNPFYAGVYVYGKSEKRTEIVDGRARKSYGHSKPFATWDVLLQEQHEGYIDWDEFERNQRFIAVNAFGQKGGIKSGRGGRALLCPPAAGVEGGWALSIRGVRQATLITAANVSNRCWPNRDA